MNDYKQVFRCLLDSLDYVVILLDTDFKVTEVNANAKELFTWEQDCILGKYFLEVFKQSGIEEPMGYVLDAIEPGKVIPLKRTSVFYKNKKHTLAWHIKYWSQVNLYILEGYIVQASFPHSLEITEEFLSVLNALPCIIFWKDSNFFYRGGNIHFLKHAGCNSFEEIVGKTDFELPWRDERESFINDDRKVLRTGRENFYIEHMLKTADGSVLNIIANKVPLKDEMNNTIGVLGIAIDVTLQKQREHRLQEFIHLEKRQFFAQSQLLESITQEVFGLNSGVNQSIDLKELVIFLKAIISNMPGNVFWKDLNSVYMGCNDHVVEVCGFSNRSDIVGLTDFELEKKLGWQSGTAERFREDDIKVITSREAQTYEDVFIQADGRKVFMFTKKTPIFNEIGKVSGILAVSLDITKLKEKKQAEAASRSKSEFIANMSHDLRTPITGMLGMLQDMLYAADQAKSSISDIDAQRNSVALKDMIETVQRDSQLLMGATDELLQLCNEILEVTRIEAGASDQHLESFALNDLLNHTIELLQPTAHHKKLQLSYALDPLVPCYLKGSRIYLDRIVLNLIGNGLKFTEKGEVRIGVSLNEGTVDASMGQTIRLKIQVKDTGIGIPEDKFDEIFEHFSRLTSSYEGVYKGSGLGLYTVKRYIEAMEGTIDVSSEIGSGTCFTIILPFVVSDHANRGKQSIRTPVSVQPATEVNLLKEQRSVSAQDAGASILIVEDNPIAAMAAKLAFKPFDCYIDMAASGAEAVAMAEQNHYDLIFMDVGLPDFSGIEATQKIRALNDSIKSQVPIVALTGHADNSEIQQDAIDSGMQEILIKPAQARALRTVLERFVFQKKV